MMLSTRTFKKGFANVTIGLLSGKLKAGRVTTFSPHHPEQRIDLAGAAGTVVTVLLPTEQVAYVGFHRNPGEAPARPSGRPLVRVRCAGVGHFTVEVAKDELGHPLGFYGVPSEPDCPYSEIFFYAHGVHAKENIEPLGEMLVRHKLLDPADLDRGLDEQVSSRSVALGSILIEQKVVTAEAVEEAAKSQKFKRLRIGEILVEAGLATPEQVERALTEQRKRSGRKLGEVLVDMGMITEVDLALTLAEKFHLPFVDLEEYAVDAAATSIVPRDLVEKYGILPVRADGGSLVVAISDPLATEFRDVLRYHLPQRRVEEVLVTSTQLRTFVEAFLAQGDQPAEELQKILDQLAIDAQAAHQVAREVETRPDISDSAIIKLVNQIIIDAYKRGASDIHVEPNGEDRPVLVRFRADGECYLYRELPSSVRASLVARMKIIASLDISERRKPQDGKIRFRFHDRMIELRVATIPTVNGNEDVVMRILAASKPMPVEGLLLSTRNLEEARKLIQQPYGLILCVGPTGSGKTTTLHSMLGALNGMDMKIWTAEDPVEITQPGLRQVQVQPRIGFTFAAAMRSFLRADPDVIMVGEMRDEETASTAVEASLTGHLVFSTLHTNSASETITRLVDMGVDPFTFADALLGVLAQRLARSLCLKCREDHETTTAEYDGLVRGLGRDHLEQRGLSPGFRTFRSRGCDQCNGGYKGRIGLHELLVVNDDLREAIQRKSPIDKIRKLAAAGGMTTLLQDGLEKALAGKTDLRQVLAACSR